MTESTSPTQEPGFFQKIGASADRFFDAGKEKWNGFWGKVGEAGTKFSGRVAEIRDNLVEKMEPLKRRFEASGLHQGVENIKGHIDTARQVFAQTRVAMGRAELKNSPNNEKLDELKSSIEDNSKLRDQCRKEAQKHYNRAAEIRATRNEIWEEDKARFADARDRVKSWFEARGSAVAEKWDKLDLRGRWQRAKESLAEAIANKLDDFAMKLRGRNRNIGNAKLVLATS